MIHSRALIKFWMISWFIYFCLRFRIDPWKFFQLNADYFNKEKGIYSKLEINQLIPYKWRLKQLVYDRNAGPWSYPVFLKPEWGQNSYGIYRADTPEDFMGVQEKIAKKKLTYLLQEAANEKREFEIYYIRQADNPDACAMLTITEVQNSYEGAFPINGVNNIHTTYTDLTRHFSEPDARIIWDHVKSIGNFRMARVCAKANSEEDLLQGAFHIVEINLFTPMPINLLDRNVSWKHKLSFIKTGMLFLAENARAISASQERKNVFFRKLAMHHKVKS
ncbi:hypothetical protein KKI24_04785 [bacterium]|nr:hypothetical protein [bacterium]